jgi:hypothetical protein
MGIMPNSVLNTSPSYQKDNAVIYPQFLKKSQRKVHQNIQRHRKDWALELARGVVASNDVVVYEDW